MKTFIIGLLLLSQTAMATCDFSIGISPGPNSTFIYTQECHLAVGALVQSNKTLSLQVGDLTQAITLKDLALTKADARTQLWMDTSQNLEGRIQKLDSMEKTNSWLYFGLGCLTVLGAGYMTAKLIGR